MNSKNTVFPSLPKVYHPSINTVTSNQAFFRKNFLEELLTRQEATNQAFTESFSLMNQSLEASNAKQSNHYMELLGEINHQSIKSEQLKIELEKNEAEDRQAMDRLVNIEEIVQEEKELSQATLQQMASQEVLTRKIQYKMESYEELFQDIQKKMKVQDHFYEEINDKLQIQEILHQTVLERLDKQDVQTIKIAEQLELLKQTLFEKLETSISSMEEKYKQTIQYLGSVFSLKERIVHLSPSTIQDVKHEEKEEVNQD